ncbi:uncharacterized protein HGUI_01055 [Hanseniaspora guilliermondii]|uniref:Protein YAE1 n=1 Tax=Hanseniaspora guilliermondii TaxID=56406 RepID=A0A1L0CVM9_9ASCO|nr:uncharacterized protein HGUI_01055 [Hanseniaspora guilliermondii]
MSINSSDQDIFFSDDENKNENINQFHTINEHNAHYKQGYVDGVSTFNNELIQQHCNKTYKLGNELGLKVGKLVGKIQFVLRHDEINMKKFLDKLNANIILQEKNFDDQYTQFINNEYIDNIEKEFFEFINETDKKIL